MKGMDSFFLHDSFSISNDMTNNQKYFLQI